MLYTAAAHRLILLLGIEELLMIIHLVQIRQNEAIGYRIPLRIFEHPAKQLVLRRASQERHRRELRIRRIRYARRMREIANARAHLRTFARPDSARPVVVLPEEVPRKTDALLQPTERNIHGSCFVAQLRTLDASFIQPPARRDVLLPVHAACRTGDDRR